MAKKANVLCCGIRNFKTPFILNLIAIMKKTIFTFATILACSFYASAQDTPVTSDSNENTQDKIQQEPPRPEQREIERTSKVSAERQAIEKKQLEAESKQKVNDSSPKSKTKVVQKKSTAPLKK
ncbi:hypothetical protein [Flavobacterium sp.]|uniref:hypothetical protein n=1 Tax=Flavobacterium sp. TaxID=239 RepID=UPI00286D1DD2|nr:hypothetical protein [Flavobacterium sp.]